jgi:glycosyltransferase involved in cell wall biosynthesis
MAELSVVIITRNEEENIRRCLASVKPVAAEVVVVDSGSVDRTAEICREAGCRVFYREFDGYGMQKQFAVDQAKNDWVLSIDADEVLSPGLQQEINTLMNKMTSSPFVGGVSSPEPVAWSIPFSLYFMGRILKHGGVGNEYHLRLFNKKRGGFTTVPVHEGIEVNGVISKLIHPVIHYSYRNISHHIEKINIYTSQAAEGYVKRGRRFSKLWVVVKFPTSFFAFYFVKRGFLDGYQGFMWSFLAAVYATLKVAKTIELNSRS